MNKERLEEIRDYARRADLVSSEAVLELLDGVDALRAALIEARAQLIFLNGNEVLASTNVVLKRIDEILG